VGLPTCSAPRPGLASAALQTSKARLRDVTTNVAMSKSRRQSSFVSLPAEPTAAGTAGHADAAPGFQLPLGISKFWDSIPANKKIPLACASAFCLSNMDKVNMTVAIIPIAQELGWSSTVAGLVQSSFFWGFLLAQVPGGYFCSSIGGRRMLPPSVALWSTATVVVPFMVTSMPALCATRSVMGLGEAMAPSAIVDMIARTVPKEQRAGAVSTAFAGLHVGSILGLLASPAIINTFGWRTLFLTFGAVGILWYAAFESLMRNIAETEPEVAARLSGRATAAGSPLPSATASATLKAGQQQQHIVPYRAFLRSTPVRALMFTHFSHNWFNYTMLAWMPTYFTDTLSVDLTHAAQTALLPPLAGAISATTAGALADALISRGAPTAVVRKLAQCIAFLIPSSLLLLASHNPCTADNNTAAVATITAALGLSSFSLAGLYCTHQDLSPKYASAMLGVTNTAAALPGVIGVATVGFLLDHTERSWDLALFLPSAAIMTTGAVVFTLFSKHDQIDFDAMDNSPFPWEAKLEPLKQGVQKVVSAVQGASSAVSSLLHR